MIEKKMFSDTNVEIARDDVMNGDAVDVKDEDADEGDVMEGRDGTEENINNGNARNDAVEEP